MKSQIRSLDGSLRIVDYRGLPHITYLTARLAQNKRNCVLHYTLVTSYTTVLLNLDNLSLPFCVHLLGKISQKGWNGVIENRQSKRSRLIELLLLLLYKQWEVTTQQQHIKSQGMMKGGKGPTIRIETEVSFWEMTLYQMSWSQWNLSLWSLY